MTAPYLPNDCIYDILKCLQLYRSTLFNCLLVNRFWCRATVPLLYADPFDVGAVNKNNSLMVLTLILCLNQMEILQLKIQLNFININNKININYKYKPLFEYLRYLENFDYFIMDSMIRQLIDKQSYDKLRPPILYQPILCRCSNIKQLSIPLYNERYKNCSIKVFSLILTKLNSLTLQFNGLTNDKIIQEYLSSIANTCLNLKNFRITSIGRAISIEKNNFCAIIQKQNNLKVIELSSYFQDILNDIFLSLEFQKYSLVRIEFKDINFNNVSFKNFINLCNLKYLLFQRCKGLSSNQCEVLKYASFKLEGLYFMYKQWNYRDFTIPSMTKHLGISLKELILYDSLNIFTIKNISRYCPNLITLKISIGSKIVDPLVFPYFKNLKIRILDINYDWDRWVDFDNTDYFEYLGINLPTNVEEISFSSFSGRLSAFENFLGNCHNCLKRINLNDYVNYYFYEFLEIILNYTRSSNSLKFLGIKQLKQDGKTSRLLEQIKANGVKVVDCDCL